MRGFLPILTPCIARRARVKILHPKKRRNYAGKGVKVNIGNPAEQAFFITARPPRKKPLPQALEPCGTGQENTRLIEGRRPLDAGRGLLHPVDTRTRRLLARPVYGRSAAMSTLSL